MDPSFLLIHIVNSTFHQPQAGPPFSPEREMFRKLSFAPTYKTLLSTRQTAVAVCRLSDSSDDQTSDGAHKHAFPYSHIEESTIHQPQAGPLIADRAVNFMEIGDFLMLWTYSQ